MSGTVAHKVLVVDDSKTELMFMTDLLQKSGFTVRTAENAEDAFRRLAEDKPDLILMDIQLPGMDGLTLTRMLKARPDHRKTIIVALTAYAMKGDEDRLLAAGCDGYVSKPIDTRTFPDTVARYLRREPAA